MDRRYSSQTNSKGNKITVVKLDKSGGCVDRDPEFLRHSQEISIREYFFGDAKRTLSPHTQQVSFDECVIYKIKEGKFHSLAIRGELTAVVNAILASFLPGGEESQDSALYEKVEPSPSMAHSILAVIYADLNDSQEHIRDATVMGFVCIAEVNQHKRTLKILAPLNTRVTDKPMIWGRWPEAIMSLE
jgi:polyribonucleotide 5'-hydroxyl-kinase